jgi:hypothetical protein
MRNYLIHIVIWITKIIISSVRIEIDMQKIQEATIVKKPLLLKWTYWQILRIILSLKYWRDDV